MTNSWMSSVWRAIVVGGLVALSCLPASAQVPGFTITRQFVAERLSEDHWRATGQVELEKDDMRFFADEVDYYPKEHRLVASGNVVYVSKENRIAADKLDFNTETRLGTFFNASGTARLTQSVDRSMFGTQEPDAYFYGEVLEKVGPDKYRIKKGGFTTCLQPTPRWEVSASTVTLTLEEYAIVKNSLLKVKGVPLFYMPIFYYPMQEDDRATGFLIPTYGTSTVRGQSLSNAFFWAINRSQDATVFYDWFSRTGQGVGGEYRYIAGPGSDGSARTYFLDEKDVTYTDSSGNEQTQPARRSYELRGTAVQRLPANLRARGDVDYFSDVTVQQTYQTNLYEASLRQRSYGGNIAGSWGATTRQRHVQPAGAVLQRHRLDGLRQRAPHRLRPRAAAPSRIAGLLLAGKRVQHAGADGATRREREVPLGLTRIDISPQFRYPAEPLAVPRG